MSSLKIFLIVSTSFLFIALCAGVFVWYLYQDLPGAHSSLDEMPSDAEMQVRGDLEMFQMEDVHVATETPMSDVSSQSASENVITITTASLTPTQRAVLETFGIADEQFEVTDSMITCAQEAVGVHRFTEIVNGSAPSPFEVLTLAPCLRR